MQTSKDVKVKKAVMRIHRVYELLIRFPSSNRTNIRSQIKIILTERRQNYQKDELHQREADHLRKEEYLPGPAASATLC